MRKKHVPILMILLSGHTLPLWARAQPRGSSLKTLADSAPAKSRACIACHEKAAAPVIVRQWALSRHAKAGVACFDCHAADPQKPWAIKHHGFYITALVTPKTCGRCHPSETRQFEASHHAQAGEILGSLDNVLGASVEGKAAVDSGCAQCHGSRVKLLKDGRPDPSTWPNQGIGRLNPDGSKGTCTACHGAHSFSVAMARRPGSCGLCHLGPDHPNYEVYRESKHGIAYRALKSRMHLDGDSWVLGKDYDAAPTCATCHMGATGGLEETHDVGARLSWNLRPAVSVKRKNWENRRAAMEKVCLNCHTSDWVGNFYEQYDSVVALYNNKFAKPAALIMKRLRAAHKLTPEPFDEKIEWTYFELWHHEGRRARMGAAMGGPDFVQWHGFYEEAKVFNTEFLPEAEKLLPGVTRGLHLGNEPVPPQGRRNDKLPQEH
ncbi:MAG: multiheme c-type cytochrome [Acidobacteriota bacterium]